MQNLETPKRCASIFSFQSSRLLLPRRAAPCSPIPRTKCWKLSYKTYWLNLVGDSVICFECGTPEGTARSRRPRVGLAMSREYVFLINHLFLTLSYWLCKSLLWTQYPCPRRDPEGCFRYQRKGFGIGRYQWAIVTPPPIQTLHLPFPILVVNNGPCSRMSCHGRGRLDGASVWLVEVCLCMTLCV